MTQKEITEQIKSLRPKYEEAEKELKKVLEEKLTLKPNYFARVHNAAERVADLAIYIERLSNEHNNLDKSWIEELKEKIDEIVKDCEEDTDIKDFIELSDGSCATAIIQVWPSVKKYHATWEVEAHKEGSVSWRAHIPTRTTDTEEIPCWEIINGKQKPLIIEGRIEL